MKALFYCSVVLVAFLLPSFTHSGNSTVPVTGVSCTHEVHLFSGHEIKTLALCLPEIFALEDEEGNDSEEHFLLFEKAANYSTIFSLFRNNGLPRLIQCRFPVDPFDSSFLLLISTLKI
jgi:hypothetical protein